MSIYDDLSTVPDDAILLVSPGVCPPFLRKGKVHICTGTFSYTGFTAWSTKTDLDPDDTGLCRLCDKMLPLWNTHVL